MDPLQVLYVAYSSSVAEDRDSRYAMYAHDGQVNVTTGTLVGQLKERDLSRVVKGAQEPIRLPERTGTWQFMSAALLMKPSNRITVQDEMESFFHLLLYFAIRYLPHDCGNVDRFINSYFNDYAYKNSTYCGGEKKAVCIHLGALTTTSRGHDLVFYLPSDSRADSSHELQDSERHPINMLLSRYLERLQARYRLYLLEEPKKAVVNPSSLALAREDAQDLKRDRGHAFISNALASYRKLPKARSHDPDAHSEAQEKDKARLQELASEHADHAKIISLLLGCYDEDAWHECGGLNSAHCSAQFALASQGGSSEKCADGTIAP
ncbi:hypothetical protein BV20DRAFT_1113883 [Pilatotrama ljubarskyi]|nr:hypothetical protein BV20DRAFT_1113883 [Pilatotrama ljubarskyi]